MRAFAALALTVLIFAGCVCKPSPGNFVPGDANTVCILSTDKPFKNEVAGKVAAALETEGRTVIRDTLENAGRYRAADFGAVVYIAEYQMWHTPRHAVRYFDQNGQARNIVFVITTGNARLKVKKPFDAVTSASTKGNTGRVASEVMTRLDAVMK